MVELESRAVPKMLPKLKILKTLLKSCSKNLKVAQKLIQNNNAAFFIFTTRICL